MRNPGTGTIAARTLPAKPNLEHLKNEAKQRLERLRAATPSAKLAEAQHQIAREYGFAHWRELKADIERRTGGPTSAAARAAIGDWIATFPTGANRFALHIRAGEDGALTAAIDTPDFGFFGLAADDVLVEGERLSFTLLAPLVIGYTQGFYEARYDAERDSWIGEWLAHGMTTALDFVRGVFPPAPRFEGLDGFWDGRLETNEGLIRLIFRLKSDAHGTYAWLDSPDRNQLGRPARSVLREGRQVTITMHTVSVTGELSENGQWIEGRFIKGETSLPLTLIHRPPGAAAPLPQRAPAIDLPPQALAAFAGNYQGEGGGPVMTVSVGDGRLKARFVGGSPRGADGVPRVQIPSGPELDLLPASATKFFHRDLDASIEFDLDGQGRATGFVMRQLGSETRAKRID
jgi:Domain of unknown function (DUF3471)